MSNSFDIEEARDFTTESIGIKRGNDKTTFSDYFRTYDCSNLAITFIIDMQVRERLPLSFFIGDKKKFIHNRYIRLTQNAAHDRLRYVLFLRRQRLRAPSITV